MTRPVSGHQFLLFPPVRPLAERFGPEFFRDVPEAPGVYLMSTARDGVLYVGKAKNLRRRLGNYRSGTGERLPRKLIRLLLRVERIDWDLCPDEATALARERQLIRALQPRFNTQGVRPPKEWFIGWSLCHELDSRIATHATVTLALSESREDWLNVRGPFAFARPAFAALLRSLWINAHPGARIADLPHRLINGPAPTRWTIPWSDPVARWLEALERYLDVAPSDHRESTKVFFGAERLQHDDALALVLEPILLPAERGMDAREEKRQRAAALQKLAPAKAGLEGARASWSATALHRFLPRTRLAIHGEVSGLCVPYEKAPEGWRTPKAGARLVLPMNAVTSPEDGEASVPLSFEAQWRALDAECLADFWIAQRRRRA